MLKKALTVVILTTLLFPLNYCNNPAAQQAVNNSVIQQPVLKQAAETEFTAAKVIGVTSIIAGCAVLAYRATQNLQRATVKKIKAATKCIGLSSIVAGCAVLGYRAAQNSCGYFFNDVPSGHSSLWRLFEPLSYAIATSVAYSGLKPRIYRNFKKAFIEKEPVKLEASK